MPQGIMPQAAPQNHTCLPAFHTWERTEDVRPKETGIKGVFEAPSFSAHCLKCGESRKLRSTDICLYCFTIMESKPVDTRMELFRKHTNSTIGAFYQTRVHTCPTCSFRCVSFTYDK